MNIHEKLKEAKALIADPERWTQRTLARSATGNPVDPTHPLAETWCAIGAVCHVLGCPVTADPSDAKTEEYRAVRRPLNECAHEVRIDELYERLIDFRPSIAHVNDNTDHATVMAMFDCAIERTKED